MHTVANSAAPSYSSSGVPIHHLHFTNADDRPGRTDEALGARIASLLLSPPSSRLSLDSFSNIPIDSRPHFPERNVPGSNGNPAPGFDVVNSHISQPPTHRARGGFDVTQLPVEIICEIFEKFVEDDLLHPIRDDTPIPLISHTCRSDPTKLGQICSGWRTVAINLPKLWSNILIYNPQTSQIHLTDVWLKRSGNNPLNLEINYDTGKGDYDIRSAAQILKSFIARLKRWKKFHLNMSIELLRPLYAIVHSPHKPLILESVELNFRNSFRYHHAEAHVDAVWKYFHGCPTLRQVVWSGHEVNSFPKHAPFQLTHVHARFSVSIDDILAFLPQIPLIRELQIEELQRPSKNPPVTISPQLLLEHLRVLRIRSYEVAASSFIASLTCPSLESLEINHCNALPQSNQDLQELPRLLQRSGCRLQKLDFRDPGINITDGELKRCLSDSPLQSLTSLCLLMDHISDQTVTLLSRKSPAGLHEFAPFLENLRLPLCETTDGMLASMVSSRWYEAFDNNSSTALGHLRNARIFPRKRFGPIDEAFFSTNVFY